MDEIKEKKAKPKVGGQALIEGVMMRSENDVSMAVRLKNKKIDVESFKITFLEKIKWYRKIPLLRGIIEMIASLVIGYKCLLKSAQKVELEEEKKEEKEEKENKKLLTILSTLAALFGVFLTIILFMFLPSLAVKQTAKIFKFNNFFKVLIEGIIKITIFISYIFITSKLPDVKRTFEYHGAEHKTIACFEADLNLTVENVKKQTRFHPRCGTNFIFIVLMISILVFSFLTWKNLIVRLILKFFTLPIVTGISYEVIRLAGKNSNLLAKILIAPGLLLQRLTTKEPDDSQIEIAITSLKEVIKDKI